MVISREDLIIAMAGLMTLADQTQEELDSRMDDGEVISHVEFESYSLMIKELRRTAVLFKMIIDTGDSEYYESDQPSLN